MRKPMMSAPIRVPMMRPLPPIRLVPPSTTAAMASSSYPMPAVGWAEERREVTMRPARADSMPHRP
ncbi:hypothetical protein D3C75_1145130 [compost metagenome]